MNWIRYTLLLAFGLSLLGLSGCEKEQPNQAASFELNVTARVSGQPFFMFEDYRALNSRTYNVSLLKMYVSNVRLVRQDGSELPVKDIHLFDFSENHLNPLKTNKTSHGEGEYFIVEVPEGDYQGVRFGVGVPAELNGPPAPRPTQYENDHPLSNTQGTFWDWNTGWRFLMLEGQVDSTVTRDGPPVRNFTYHTGTDTLYREFEFVDSQHNFTTERGKELQFVLEMDLNRLFVQPGDTLDMAKDSVTHTTADDFWIAQKITNNLDESFFAFTELSVNPRGLEEED